MIYNKNIKYQVLESRMNYTNEERTKALNVSLTFLASSLGFTPIRIGNYFSLKEMDSLRIYDDKTWYRWSGKGERKGGTQIDFMLEFGNCNSVPEAIKIINGNKIDNITINHVSDYKQLKEKDMVLPKKNTDYKRLYAYLIKTRKISVEVVNYFVKNHLIYEEESHHNIVFLGKDPEGKIKYAGLRGTADLYGKKFKGDVYGNDKNYGVNLVNKECDEIKVFESVIDLMSYMDITKDYTSNKIVLGMVEDNPLEQFLKDYAHISKICFCLDNDDAGNNHVEVYKTKYKEYDVSIEIPSYGKDWNESLIFLKENVKVKGCDSSIKGQKEAENNELVAEEAENMPERKRNGLRSR